LSLPATFHRKTLLNPDAIVGSACLGFITICATHPIVSDRPVILAKDSSIPSHLARETLMSCFTISSYMDLSAPYLLIASPPIVHIKASSVSRIFPATFFIVDENVFPNCVDAPQSVIEFINAL